MHVFPPQEDYEYTDLAYFFDPSVRIDHYKHYNVFGIVKYAYDPLPTRGSGKNQSSIDMLDSIVFQMHFCVATSIQTLINNPQYE